MTENKIMYFVSDINDLSNSTVNLKDMVEYNINYFFIYEVANAEEYSIIDVEEHNDRSNNYNPLLLREL